MPKGDKNRRKRDKKRGTRRPHTAQESDPLDQKEYREANGRAFDPHRKDDINPNMND